MQVIAEHKETGQVVQGLLTTARIALRRTYANWNLDPQELVIEEQCKHCYIVYELSKMIKVRKYDKV